MERPQKRTKTAQTRPKGLTIDAYTAAAKARNEATNTSASRSGAKVAATYEDKLLSEICAELDINPLTALLEMKRSDTGKETCTVRGYIRGSPYSKAFDHRVGMIVEHLKQGEVGGPVSRKVVKDMEDMFEKFSASNFCSGEYHWEDGIRLRCPLHAQHTALEVFAHGKLVEFFAAAIDIKAATVRKKTNCEIEIKCEIENADVLDLEFEQNALTQDEINYIAAKKARASIEAEMKEVNHHLETLKKKPIPFNEERFSARGRAVFMTITALNISVPTQQLSLTRVDNVPTFSVELTGYSNATPYSQTLHARVNTIFAALGYTTPSSTPAFGTTPPKITNQKMQMKWIGDFYLLTHPKTSEQSHSATLYAKETNLILGILYRTAMTPNVNAEVQLLPTGFVKVVISGLELEKDLYKAVQGAVGRMYRDTEGVLGRDERRFVEMVKSEREEEEFVGMLEREIAGGSEGLRDGDGVLSETAGLDNVGQADAKNAEISTVREEEDFKDEKLVPGVKSRPKFKLKLGARQS